MPYSNCSILTYELNIMSAEKVHIFDKGLSTIGILLKVCTDDNSGQTKIDICKILIL